MRERFERLLAYQGHVLWVSHIVLIALAYLLAFTVEADLNLCWPQWHLFHGTLPMILLIRLGIS